MNFILHIKCTEQQEFNYSNPFLDQLKKEIEADFLDLDNFSEAYLIDQAGKALEIADKCAVFFDLGPGSDTKAFLKIATWLADHPEKSIVFVNGKEERISKLLFAQDGFCYHALPEEKRKEIIKDFLKH
jgi:hypothetical protein